MPIVERSRLQRSTFLVLFALALYAFWRTLEPIWVPVLLGLVIAVAVYPLHEKWVRRLRGRNPGLPAALLTAAVMVLALAVIAFLVFVVGQRMIGVAQEMAARYQNKGAVGLLGGADRDRLDPARGRNRADLGAGRDRDDGHRALLQGPRRPGMGRRGRGVHRRLRAAAETGRHAHQDERSARLHRHLRRHRSLRDPRRSAGADRGRGASLIAAHLPARLSAGGTGTDARRHRPGTACGRYTLSAAGGGGF